VGGSPRLPRGEGEHDESGGRTPHLRTDSSASVKFTLPGEENAKPEKNFSGGDMEDFFIPEIR
jgi:hypothetical protein